MSSASGLMCSIKEIICFQMHPGELLGAVEATSAFSFGFDLVRKIKTLLVSKTQLQCAEKQEGGSSKCEFSAALGPADVEITSCLSINCYQEAWGEQSQS